MRLLETGFIGKLELKNRVIMAPMGNGLSDIDGGFNAQARAYFGSVAKGGAAMVMACGFTTRRFEGGPGTVNYEDPAGISRLEQLITELHSYGCKFCAQLVTGAGRVGGSFHGTGAAPSSDVNKNFWTPEHEHRAYTIDEIHFLVEAYGKAAANAKRAGADAIEFHGYGGYLIDQFMTAAWNRRTDGYGGDLQGRMRFPLELIQEVRKQVGPDFPLIFKFTPNHHFEGGRTMDEGIEIAKMLEAAGIDALHVDDGCYEQWFRAIPPVYAYKENSIVKVAAEIQKVVSIPVMGAGKLGNPRVAEQALQDGDLDFVVLGRPLLSDPQWVNKVSENRCDDITPCCGCNEGCMVRNFSGKRLGCAVNPMTGKELENGIRPSKQQKVLIIGGGPAGMEAAVTAAKEGHIVELWEKDERLGGNLIAAGAPEFKKDVANYVNYLISQVYKKGITVKTMVNACPDAIVAYGADLVIIATGSSSVVPRVKGVDSPKVVTALDVLKRRRYPEGRIAVIGGGLVGIETALHLDMLGMKVTIVEMLDRILAEGVFRIDELKLHEMLSETDIDIMTSTRLEEVTENGIIVSSQGVSKSIDCDAVVLAVGFRSNNNLYEAVKGRVKDVVKIGDAVRPRKILDAVWEGYGAIRALAEKDGNAR